MWFFALLLLLISADYIQAYKAAVVHYYPKAASSPQKTILQNVNEYRKFAARARRQNVDILIFPEYGLVTTAALDHVEYYSIKLEDNIVMERLRAIAQDNQIYLVVNLFEQIDESFYNTNVVLDRNGSLIHKFQKIHLFNERNLSPGSLNQTLSFSTDFGVTFGLFTCFDIFFENPSQLVVRDNNIRDIIFVTGWMPSYISLSFQQGYSVSNRVNFLAANYGRVADARSGSGFFLADGRSFKIFTNFTKSTMLVREIPEEILENRKRFPKIKRFNNFEKHSTREKYLIKRINLGRRKAQISLDNPFLECNISVVLDSQPKSTDIYKAMIFASKIVMNDTCHEFRICSLLACFNETIDTCGAITNVTTKFKKISVRAHFPEGPHKAFYRPITFSSLTTPLNIFSYFDNNATKSLLIRKQDNVNIAGIIQRIDYSLEPGNRTANYANFYTFLPLFWGRPYYYPLSKLLLL